MPHLPLDGTVLMFDRLLIKQTCFKGRFVVFFGVPLFLPLLHGQLEGRTSFGAESGRLRATLETTRNAEATARLLSTLRNSRIHV